MSETSYDRLKQRLAEHGHDLEERVTPRTRGDMADIMQGALSQSEEELARVRMAYRIALKSRAYWRKAFMHCVCIAFVLFIAGYMIGRAYHGL